MFSLSIGIGSCTHRQIQLHAPSDRFQCEQEHRSHASLDQAPSVTAPCYRDSHSGADGMVRFSIRTSFCVSSNSSRKSNGTEGSCITKIILLGLSQSTSQHQRNLKALGWNPYEGEGAIEISHPCRSNKPCQEPNFGSLRQTNPALFHVHRIPTQKCGVPICAPW